MSNVLRKANVRHGVMARLAKSAWGLEAGVLRPTHLALLPSITNYRLGVYSSGAHESVLKKLETLRANVPARRITAIARSARLAAEHMVAGFSSVRNQYSR